MRHLVVIVASTLVAASTLADDRCAQPSPREMAEALGVELPRLPWHLANIWWRFEEPVRDFESLEVDVAIDRDVSDDYNLYISPCGSATINGLQFYGGMQTNINGWANKQSRTRVHRGHGAIFSRWSADKRTPIGLDHVRTAADDCLVESAGYEGEFASVRRPYAWKAGNYTWSITKGETIEHNGQPATWFTCRVKNLADDTEVEMGSLLFEGEKFTYGDRHSAFVEVYSTSKIPRSNIPKVNVIFGMPRLNGEKPVLEGVSAYYPNQGGAGSPDCATVRTERDSCIVEVGPIFRRNEQQRSHELKLEPTGGA